MKAKDPMGNTRWKGAFTGGFEAGYKNTCGSKDGWTPSSFVSSVYNRAQPIQQDVLKFMDKEDLGRETIQSNVGLCKDYVHETTILNITKQQSVGARILQRLKNIEAVHNAPENEQEMQKLLEIYEKEQVQGTIQEEEITQVTQPLTVNAKWEQVEDDEFICAYEEMYRKVVRGQIKDETEEQAQKRQQDNVLSFDFTKPLEDEPEYLREIHEQGQPRKRKKNLINQLCLKDLFHSPSQTIAPKAEQQTIIVPTDYNPFHRVMDSRFEQELLRQKQKKKLSVSERSAMLGEQRLSDRFVSARNALNKFIVSDEKTNEMKAFFQNEEKNKRYDEYVLEMEGKGISAQLENRNYEEIERQKKQFEELYYKQSQQKQKPTVHENKHKNINIRIVRTIEPWQPEKLLSKKFNSMSNISRNA